MGGFATTLLTLSLSMMGFRGVHTQSVFVGDLCFAAGIGMLISAQWEIVRGNTFAYTVLSAFGKLFDARIIELLFFQGRLADLNLCEQVSSTAATARL